MRMLVFYNNSNNFFSFSLRYSFIPSTNIISLYSLTIEEVVFFSFRSITNYSFDFSANRNLSYFSKGVK